MVFQSLAIFRPVFRKTCITQQQVAALCSGLGTAALLVLVPYPSARAPARPVRTPRTAARLLHSCRNGGRTAQRSHFSHGCPHGQLQCTPSQQAWGAVSCAPHGRLVCVGVNRGKDGLVVSCFCSVCANPTPHCNGPFDGMVFSLLSYLGVREFTASRGGSGMGHEP